MLEVKVSKPNEVHSMALKGMVFPVEAAFSAKANLKLIKGWLKNA